MRNNFYKALFFLTLLIPGSRFFAQLATAPVYTACPNQVVTVTYTWNNVAITSTTLLIPTGGSGPVNPGTSLSFTISGTATGNFTLLGTGNGSSGTTTSSVQFNLTINNPPALTMTNSINYCPGQTAVINVTPVASSYVVNGPNMNNVQFNTNIINIPNVSSSSAGVYTIQSIASCTQVGTTTINVAPNTPITVNTTSNVCEGSSSSFTLTANLPNGSDYQWYDPYTQPMTGSQTGTPNIQVGPPVIYSMSGVYQVIANFNYNGIQCARQATTQINVVQTNPVSVAASPGNVLCQGDKLSLSAGAGAAYAYAWSGPAGFNSSISNPTIFPVTNANGGVYTVTAYFTNNFITCQTFNTITVSIVPVTPPIISMPSSACQNSTVNISATAGTGATYEWFGPGFSSTSQSTVVAAIQPSNAGTYYVTAKYSAGSTTCAATASTQLNVVQLNTISVIPPQPVCQPNNAYLQANSTGAISYQWVGPNSYSASGSNVTVYYPTPSASGIYTVTASFGNSSLICKNTNTVSLTVSPVLNFSLVPRQQMCYNSSVQVTGPAGADTYTWTSSTGFTSNDKDITFPSIQPWNAGTYTVNVNLGPCITSGSTTIEVLTPISFTLTPKDRTVCRGDTVMLAAGVTGGSENYAYLWNPSIYMNSPTGPSKTIVPLGTVIYNVNVHDIACPHFTLSQSFSVNVNQPPQPTIELPQSEGCVPFCTSYKADTTGDAAIITYDFGGLRKFQSDTSFTYCIDQPGTYTLTVLSKGTNGCSGKYVYPYPLVVNPKPGGDIFWSPEKPTTADEVTFYSRYSYEPVIYHNWQFFGGEPTVIDTAAITGPGTDTTNADNPKRKYNIYGKYPVMLISKNDRECTDTVVKFIDVIDDLNVYIPNSFTPNGDGLNDDFGVKGMGIKPEGFSMELCDRAGATFFKTKDINERWDGTIKGEKAMNGIYIYKVRAVGLNGEGRREYVGFFTLLK